MIGVWVLDMEIINEKRLVVAIRSPDIVVRFAVKGATINITRRSLCITNRRNSKTGIVKWQGVFSQCQPPFRHTPSLYHIELLEWMIKMTTFAIPIHETNCEFIAGVTLGHPIVFSQAEELKKQMYVAESGFSHTDSADIRRLHE